MSFYDSLINNAAAIIIAIPLLFAFATPLVGKINKKLRNGWAFLAVFLSGALMYVLAWEVFKNGGGEVSYYIFGGGEGALSGYDALSNVRITFYVDGIAAFMGLIMSTVAFGAIIYSFSFVKKYTGQDKSC
jgi:multicomponent Na+:H+ antiporter subunit D